MESIPLVFKIAIVLAAALLLGCILPFLTSGATARGRGTCWTAS